MKIGIIDVDCHGAKKKWGATQYPNLALCKIAAYHRAKGDTVEWATAFEHYDMLYMAKIFNFSPDDLTCYNADTIIKGGTGYSITSNLPQDIDDMQPDYSIYPSMPTDTSFGFITRGCPNKCAWCVVPRKEGNIHPYWDIDRVANGRMKVVLMDNNILASGDYGKEQIRKIIERGYRIDFNQAMDARLLTEEWADLLVQVKWIDNRVRFGCDNKPQVEHCLRAMDMFNERGAKLEFFFYTMLHGKFDECFERINTLKQINDEHRRNHSGRGVYAYAQPYRDPDNPKNPIPQWQKDMAQWCNKRMLYTSCEFADFSPRKGFKCKEYFN